MESVQARIEASKPILEGAGATGAAVDGVHSSTERPCQECRCRRGHVEFGASGWNAGERTEGSVGRVNDLDKYNGRSDGSSEGKGGGTSTSTGERGDHGSCEADA